MIFCIDIQDIYFKWMQLKQMIWVCSTRLDVQMDIEPSGCLQRKCAFACSVCDMQCVHGCWVVTGTIVSKDRMTEQCGRKRQADETVRDTKDEESTLASFLSILWHADKQ